MTNSKAKTIDQLGATRLRVEELYSSYARAIDDDRLEEWPSLFTEAGVYRITTRENFDKGLTLSMMYCDGRGMMIDRIKALRTANVYEPHVYCHLFGALQILPGEDELRAQSNFTVIRTMQEGDTSIFAVGRTFDRILDEDGTLRFSERTMVLDSRRIDTLLVIPV